MKKSSKRKSADSIEQDIYSIHKHKKQKKHRRRSSSEEDTRERDSRSSYRKQNDNLQEHNDAMYDKQKRPRRRSSSEEDTREREIRNSYKKQKHSFQEPTNAMHNKQEKHRKRSSSEEDTRERRNRNNHRKEKNVFLDLEDVMNLSIRRRRYHENLTALCDEISSKNYDYTEKKYESSDRGHTSSKKRSKRSASMERERYGKWTDDPNWRRGDFSDRERHHRNSPKEDRTRKDNMQRNISSSYDENVSDKNSNIEKNQSEKDNFKKQQDIPGPVDSTEPLSKRMKIGNINTRTGGAYIPPAKLRMMQEKIQDKSSEEYQRIAWEALKKSIVGMTNKVNSSNLTEIVPELFKENIIRGRGVLSRAILQAQSASPIFTRVYAALVAVINTKFPEIGELILKRLIIQYKRGYRRNNKTLCMTAAKFIAHLLNQEVAHEVLMLEMLTHLLENPTEDSIEIAVATLKECGSKLTKLTPTGMRAITDRVRSLLHEGSVDVRVRYMIEVYFAVEKDNFKDFEAITKELDLVEEEDKYTHLITLDDEMDTGDMLNIFQFDPNYTENEEKYKSVAKEILGDDSDEDGSADDEEESDEEEESKNEESQQIIDMTETNVVCLRRKIYLTIQSSLDFEECAHKLLKLELQPGQILEMCYMILDCCAQQRTYEKFYGLLAQRFCQLNKIYVEPFTEIFENSYKTIHRLETNKLRNVAKFFAHLLYTDAISWAVLSIIKLNEEETSSSSRIFIKILFQELCEYMSLQKLNERVKDVTLQEAFDGLFPRDHPHNTRFAINFFTSIGLGGLTDELREHLKNLPKPPIPIVPVAASPEISSSSSTSSSSSSSSSSTSSSSSDSDSDERSKKYTKMQKRKK